MNNTKDDIENTNETPLPSSLYGQAKSVNGWVVSLFIPADDSEQYVAMLVPHKEDEPKTPKDNVKNTRTVPLFHPILFGIDIDDLDSIDKELTKLDEILENEK